MEEGCARLFPDPRSRCSLLEVLKAALLDAHHAYLESLMDDLLRTGAPLID